MLLQNELLFSSCVDWHPLPFTLMQKRGTCTTFFRCPSEWRVVSQSRQVRGLPLRHNLNSKTKCALTVSFQNIPHSKFLVFINYISYNCQGFVGGSSDFFRTNVMKSTEGWLWNELKDVGLRPLLKKNSREHFCLFMMALRRTWLHGCIYSFVTQDVCLGSIMT